MPSTRLIIALSLVAFMLAACSDAREELGLGRDVPNEFDVVNQPPLSMPPDFTLRPPDPGAARPQAVSTSQQANAALFGGDANTVPPNAAGDSPIEKTLLAKTDASAAMPNIRTVVDQEDAHQMVGSQHLVDRLLWWKKAEKPGVVVNAPEEAARIKAAQEKGQPLDKGATPIIERQKSGWLGL
ncbi:MAG TPA: DUF3035 domain-containing protein [Alphaproteobacteria bacterium]|nr:DUF3035 domain-containing protein [Alphaproteobacteria bacterium]